MENNNTQIKADYSDKKILSSLQGKTHKTPPIWLMRQAGRYLEEYRNIRKEAGGFLDMCFNPDLASEVTLQPIRRFGFDGAIIFSDILVIPYAMGVELDYVQGEGPKLGKIDTAEKIAKLDVSSITAKLNPVFEALQKTYSELPDETTLIGFAGSPWTVATYMIEGGGSKDFANVRKFAYAERKSFEQLIQKLVDATIEYLSGQIKAGAEVIQLFDSWSGILPENEFIKWVIQPTDKIVSALKKLHPDIPIIGFPKGAGLMYERYIKEIEIDGVGLDFTVPLEWVRDVIQPHVCVQGNLDPILLANDAEGALKEAGRIINILGDNPFIFNLGHGILPYTPIENVERLVEFVRK